MILADTSAWVEYLRATGSPVNQRMRRLVDEGAELRTTEMVAMEVLFGARNDAHHAELEQLLARFGSLPLDVPGDFGAAVELARRCRRGGETVRKPNDCLVAAVALRTGAAVLHADRDFAVLARHTPLRLAA